MISFLLRMIAVLALAGGIFLVLYRPSENVAGVNLLTKANLSVQSSHSARPSSSARGGKCRSEADPELLTGYRFRRSPDGGSDEWWRFPEAGPFESDEREAGRGDRFVRSSCQVAVACYEAPQGL
jgi:hypothetical protein